MSAHSSKIEAQIYQVAPAEKRWAVGFGALVLFLTFVPYLLGYYFQRQEWRFTGFVFGVEDGNSYIAKMLSGAAGAWLFRTPYTPYPQQGAIMFLPYLLLGKLASPPGIHEQLVALYHLFRLAAGMLEVVATYEFLARFLTDRTLRRLGTALVVLGGGLGWIAVLLGRQQWLGDLPLEFYSPESFGFLGLYGFPHLALARALMLWGLCAWLDAVEGRAPPNASQALRIGGLWLAAGIAQPLVWFSFGFVISSHLLWLLFAQALRILQSGKVPAPDRMTIWRRWLRLARLAIAAGVFPAILVIYQAYAVLTDPFLKAWSVQNKILSPHPAHYLLAYGALLPFLAVGAFKLLKTQSWKAWLPVSWAIALLPLAYLPVNLQRRLPEGVWAAFVALAMYAVENPPQMAANLAGRLWGKIRPSLLIGLLMVTLCIPSTLILLAGGAGAAVRPSSPAFRSAEEVRAFLLLAAEAAPGSVVLTSYETGNALPAWAPVRVVIGHGPESAGLEQLRREVSAFFADDTPDKQRLVLLHSLNIRYVFWGPEERKLGSWEPGKSKFLVPVFQEGQYQLFERIDGITPGQYDG